MDGDPEAREGEKPTMTMPPDAGLYAAAMADVARLRREFIGAVEQVQAERGAEREVAHAYARLDRARANLAAALTILDYSRGDGAG